MQPIGDPAPSLHDHGRSPSSCSGHVIVCGLHDVGLRVVEQLVAAGEQVVVVDDNPNHPLVRVIAGWNVPYLAGSAQRASTLEAAGLAARRRGRLRRVRRPAEPRDRAAGPPAAARGAGRRLADQRRRRTGDRPGHRPAHRARRRHAGRARPSSRPAWPGTPTSSISAASCSRSCRSRPRRPARCAAMFGDLAPIAVVSGLDGEIAVCPGRDLIVAPGRSGRRRRHRGRPRRPAPARATASREPVAPTVQPAPAADPLALHGQPGVRDRALAADHPGRAARARRAVDRCC